MLDRSFVDDDLDEDVRPSVTSISSQSVMLFEDEMSEEEQRMKQISYHRDNLEYNERELKMLPSKIALYINDIKDADQNIETISQKLGPNKAKEGKMEKQISSLRMFISGMEEKTHSFTPWKQFFSMERKN
jgi:chromosome segregation ATPase